MKKNIFNSFFNKVVDVPFPLKQLLCIKLAKELEECCNKPITASDSSFVSYIPILTFKGETELLEKKCGLDNNIYRFLQCCADGMGILEISINTFLTLEETAKYYEFCLEQNFIEKPNSKNILATAEFLSGKIRLGEYFRQLEMITDNQLDEVVKSCSDSKRVGEILIENDFVKEKDLKEILMLKENSTKRFILDHNDFPTTKVAFTDEKQKYEQEITALKNENINLKRKMQQILKLVKQNEQL